jgi:hypothetical protein
VANIDPGLTDKSSKREAGNVDNKAAVEVKLPHARSGVLRPNKPQTFELAKQGEATNKKSCPFWANGHMQRTRTWRHTMNV